MTAQGNSILSIDQEGDTLKVVTTFGVFELRLQKPTDTSTRIRNEEIVAFIKNNLRIL